MKNLFFILLILVSMQSVFASEVLFHGNITVDIKTNIPGFSFKGKTVKQIIAKTKKEKENFKSVEIKIDPKNIDTGIELRNKHMRKKVFNNKIASFHSSKMSCLEKEDTCVVTGVLKIGVHKKTINLKLKKVSENEIKFKKELSLKELNVKKIEFMKLSVKDKVVVYGTFKKKN